MASFSVARHKEKKKSIRAGDPTFEDSAVAGGEGTLLKLALIWAYQMPVTTAMEMGAVASAVKQRSNGFKSSESSALGGWSRICGLSVILSINQP